MTCGGGLLAMSGVCLAVQCFVTWRYTENNTRPMLNKYNTIMTPRKGSWQTETDVRFIYHLDSSKSRKLLMSGLFIISIRRKVENYFREVFKILLLNTERFGYKKPVLVTIIKSVKRKLWESPNYL